MIIDNGANFCELHHNQCPPDDFHLHHDHDDSEVWISSSWTSNCTQTNGLSRNMIHTTTYDEDVNDDNDKSRNAWYPDGTYYFCTDPKLKLAKQRNDAQRSTNRKTSRDKGIGNWGTYKEMAYDICKQGSLVQWFGRFEKLKIVASCQVPLQCFSWLIPVSEIGLLYPE